MVVEGACAVDVGGFDVGHPADAGRWSVLVLVVVGEVGEDYPDLGIPVGVGNGPQQGGHRTVHVDASALELGGQAVDLGLGDESAPDKVGIGRFRIGTEVRRVLDQPVGVLGLSDADEVHGFRIARELGHVGDEELNDLPDIQSVCGTDAHGRQQEHRRGRQKACQAGSRPCSHTQPPPDERQHVAAAG